ncbi:MAG: FHA domain-containing protein [Ktedonobacteraceae bacterium]|nr:FHA domain-containing protein [Ktedonobacteraceae bacterium]
MGRCFDSGDRRKTTINAVDFPTWFSAGCYSGLACCMFAIAVNALFTNLRQRGTTRQLAGAIVVCVIAALLLLLALVWYNLRFSVGQGKVATAEVELALVYVALWGWGLPLGVTATYCLFTSPRNTTTAMHIALQMPGATVAAVPTPPRYRQGVASPYVFDEETPWGWLQYRTGSFQGQQLALKRQVATLGRDEDCDIWLDDDMASRYHAELAYDKGKVYLTDCDSLNGVLLNGKRIRGTTTVEANDLIQIGDHCFSFILAAPRLAAAEQSDPLARHTLRSSLHGLTKDGDILPNTPPPYQSLPIQALSDETAEIDYKVVQSPPTNPGGAVIIRNGEMAEQSFLLDRAVISVGRGPESDIVINDTSISRRHVQFLRQPDGDYVQDLGSRNGTQVNGELLRTPRLLLVGDTVELGNVRLQYAALPTAYTIPTARIVGPPSSSGLISGPSPLKLPSKRQ